MLSCLCGRGCLADRRGVMAACMSGQKLVAVGEYHPYREQK